MALRLISHFFCSGKLKVYNLFLSYFPFLFLFQEKFANLRHPRLSFSFHLFKKNSIGGKILPLISQFLFLKKQSSLTLCKAQQWAMCLQQALNSKNCLPAGTMLPYTKPCIRLPATIWMLKLLHHQVRPDNWGLCSGTMPFILGTSPFLGLLLPHDLACSLILLSQGHLHCCTAR